MDPNTAQVPPVQPIPPSISPPVVPIPPVQPLPQPIPQPIQPPPVTAVQPSVPPAVPLQPVIPAQAVLQQMGQPAVPQVPQGYGGAQKEQLILPPAPVSEKAPLVELHESEKIPEEVEGWMEKLEQAGEIKIPEAIKKDEQILMDNAVPTQVQDVVMLPLTQSGAAVAAKKTVNDSAKWLWAWCQRLVKMLGDRAKYRV